MNNFKLISLLAGSVLMPASLFAQAAAPAAPAGPVGSIHGHVNNAAGIAVTNGKVEMTTDKTVPTEQQKIKYSFDIGPNGDFKGAGVAPGDYIVYVVQGKVHVDYLEETIKANEDKAADFDMTRKEFIDKMTPEEKTALEEYKKRAGEAIAANKTISNLNNALKSVHDDMASANPNYDQDVKTMQDAVAQKADEPVLWYNLGNTQISAADAKVKTAKANKTSWQSDDSITKLYTDGVGSYQKGIDLNTASKKPNPTDAGIAYNAMGNAYAKMGKAAESQAAFDNAVKVAPATAAMVYNNEAAVLFNAGSNEAAAAAADKAIAADPTRPDPYFIKGQSLVSKATVDAKGAIVAPPGCIEAYQKYLELAPDGSHAQDVKDILTGMGQTISTKYSAGKTAKAPAKK